MIRVDRKGSLGASLFVVRCSAATNAGDLLSFYLVGVLKDGSLCKPNTVFAEWQNAISTRSQNRSGIVTTAGTFVLGMVGSSGTDLSYRDRPIDNLVVALGRILGLSLEPTTGLLLLVRLFLFALGSCGKPGKFCHGHDLGLPRLERLTIPASRAATPADVADDAPSKAAASNAARYTVGTARAFALLVFFLESFENLAATRLGETVEFGIVNIFSLFLPTLLYSFHDSAFLLVAASSVFCSLERRCFAVVVTV